MSTPAQVTEEHIYTTAKVGKAYVAGEDAQAAQLIADSEARACDQLRAEVERLKEYSANLENDVKYLTHGVPEGDPLFLAVARAERAEADADSTRERALTLANSLDEAQAELAAERARLDWLLSRMGGNVLPVNKCVAWTVDVYHYGNRFPSRAAIDAAMKEGSA